MYTLYYFLPRSSAPSSLKWGKDCLESNIICIAGRQTLRSLRRRAGVQGIEPRLTVPETAVLPLDDTPIYNTTSTYALTKVGVISGRLSI